MGIPVDTFVGKQMKESDFKSHSVNSRTGIRSLNRVFANGDCRTKNLISQNRLLR